MTESDLLAAQLEALGLDPERTVDRLDDAVFEAYVRMTREHKRLPSQRDVGDQLNISQRTVSAACYRLVRAGRMRLVRSLDSGGRARHMPIVTVETK